MNRLLKVRYADEPSLFDDIEEFFVDRFEDHRRGSSYYLHGVVELTPEHAEDFEDVEDFDKYVGTWMTNQITSDWEWGTDECFVELTRVEKVEKISYEWKESTK